MVTEILVETTNQERCERIAAGISEIMIDEGFDLEKALNTTSSGGSQKRLRFKDPDHSKERN